MNNADSEKRGHVIPKWLTLGKAILRGEILVPRKHAFAVNRSTKERIQEELLEFEKNPTLESACYLLGAATLTGDEDLSRKIAYFIKRDGSEEMLTGFADDVLGIEELDLFAIRIDLQIAKLKAWIRKFPKSPVSWIELGRLYTIKGQKDKGRKAVITALSLAPFDRYIVRCGVRFFLHIFDFDAAWHYISKANSNVRDPWLKATELNVAMLNNKKTPNLKGFLPQATKGINLFHYSELHESAGLLELNSGNRKKAKKHFRAAWSEPSEAVITHGEWIIRNRFPGLKEDIDLNYAGSLEALTWANFYNYDITEALETARLWQEEEPYSRAPYMVGASIAGCLGLHDDAVDFAEEGLQANPNDSKLLNSLSYALLRAGKVQESKEIIKKWEQVEEDKESNVFYLATAGLFMFKIGNDKEGRRLYLDSIAKCKERGDEYLVGKAYLNLALAECESRSSDAEETTFFALDLTKDTREPDIRSLREELISKASKGCRFKDAEGASEKDHN